ncbi:hypothetical protein Bca52824_004304 [Brassica carinata]|uniref:PGG domain-containing protein n=2 Tax=Brassica carinata TaxID=52824 RepID=A0A8X7WNV8_BRACI|nr:hypothetical protein Bca52824_004304 [Brassica carinata]
MSLNRNIQNKSGMTALDALRVNGPQMNKETESIIKISGGKSGLSLSRVETTSVFLSKPVTFREYCSTEMARYRNCVSDGTRNCLLVITALIITATYQIASQPQETDQSVNSTFHDGILKIMLLWGFNTLAFLFAIILTFILLPDNKEYTWWYIMIMAPLVCSYASLVYQRIAQKETILICLIMYLTVASALLFQVLLLYVKWKRTTWEKVQKSRIELISQGLESMV